MLLVAKNKLPFILSLFLRKHLHVLDAYIKVRISMQYTDQIDGGKKIVPSVKNMKYFHSNTD